MDFEFFLDPSKTPKLRTSRYQSSSTRLEEIGLPISSEGNSLAEDQESSVRGKRRSASEMLAAKKIELARFQARDISKLKPDRQAAQEAKIAAIISEIRVYEAKFSSKEESGVKRQLPTSDENSANTVKKARTLWTDNDARRLVQARTLHNDIFQEHNNNTNQKRYIVTDTFNNGSQQSDTNKYYSLELPLEPEKHRTKEVIQHKFKDIVSEFRSILLFEDPSYIVNQN